VERSKTCIQTSIIVAVFSLLVLAPGQVIAQEHKPYVGSKAFEQMKQLVGTWEGTMDMGKGQKKITASYKLTSGGSAIIETVFEDTPMEMVTVYHDDSNKTLQMTHYCALGNQPKMALKSMENNQLWFTLSPDSGVDLAKERHMHAAAITFDGPSNMTQHWTEFKDGEMGKPATIVYTRVK